MVLGGTETKLIEPLGGELIDLLVGAEEREELQERAPPLKRLQLTPRSVCDLELLATGAFSPLDRFMRREDYERVLEEMRLASGALFPLPVTLPAAEDANVRAGEEVALADQHNNLLAVLLVEEVFEREGEREAALACGTTDARHPLVAEMNSWGRLYVAGRGYEMTRG